MRRVARTLLALGIGFPVASPSAAEGGCTFTSPVYGFSVDLPSPPSEDEVESTIDVPGRGRLPVASTVFLSMAKNGVVFSVQASAYPACVFDAESPGSLIDGAVRGVLGAGSNGRLVRSEPTTLDGNPGVAFVAHVDHERSGWPYRITGRIYVVGNRAFTLSAIEREQAPPDPAVARFLSSFQVQALGE